MTFLRPARVLAAVVALSALAACGTPEPGPEFPDLTFAHLEPIRLDVARIELVESYRPPLARPNVEHEFPLTPASATARWVKDRLKPVGTGGVARVVLQDASVLEVILNKTEGMKGLVVTDQAERYDATLNVDIEILDEAGAKAAFVNALAKRSRTVPEDITLNDRERVYFELTEALMQDLNAEMEKQITQHLAGYRR